MRSIDQNYEKIARTLSQLIGYITKRFPSREKIDELRRIALWLEGLGNEEDAGTLLDLADLLLDFRQKLRGGSREMPGGPRWKDF